MAGALINLEWPGETPVIIASQDDITMNDPLYVSLSLSLSVPDSDPSESGQSQAAQALGHSHRPALGPQ